MQKLNAHGDYINCVAWSPDSQRLATGGSNALGLWDASGDLASRIDYKWLFSPEHGSNHIYSLAWSPDSKDWRPLVDERPGVGRADLVPLGGPGAPDAYGADCAAPVVDAKTREARVRAGKG